MVKVDENGNGIVNIAIPEEWFEKKEKFDSSWREIIGLGLKAKEDNPQLIGRIRDLEMKTEKMEKKQWEQEGEIKLLMTILKQKVN